VAPFFGANHPAETSPQHAEGRHRSGSAHQLVSSDVFLNRYLFSSNVADRTDDCRAYLTDTFREVICHQEELMSALVEHGDRDLDLSVVQ
jgi:hypothetical protein